MKSHVTVVVHVLILLFSIYMQLPDPGDNMDDDSDSDMSDISGLSETVWKTTPGKRK